MGRGHRTAGLDQLGPVRGYVDPPKDDSFGKLIKANVRKPLTIKQAVTLSALHRRVKVTLPAVRFGASDSSNDD